MQGRPRGASGVGPSYDMVDSSATAGERAEPRPHARHVLVVEDDPDIREGLTDALAGIGYTVEAVVDGRAALDCMRRHQPDIVVLDLMMPVMDGWQFRAEQKRDPDLASIPVVVISGNDSAAAAAVDADFYLRKPLSADTLIDAIEHVLGVEERRREPARLAQAERMAALGTLAAGMAHEINNPLTYVLLHLRQAADLLGGLTGGPHEAVARQLAPLIAGATEGSERIHSITTGIRAFSRVNDERPLPVDLRAVVDAAVRLVAHEIRQRAQLTCEHAEAPAVLISEGHIGQVLLNLLTNAVQAIPAGDAAAHEIRIRTGVAADGWAQVEVTDTGHGIPDHVLGRIFEPFFTTKPVGQGTGLGLSISHGIVKSAGGRIEVSSAAGRGTTFRVALPPMRARADAPAPADRGVATELRPARAAPAPEPRRRRVLVVDDEPGVLEAIRRLLAREHDVTTASSGRLALELLANEGSFDLILCDLNMPELGGMQVHGELVRTRPELASRIVFMSGGVFTEASRAFLDTVDCPVLAKPFDPDELRKRVSSGDWSARAGGRRPSL